MKNYDLVELSDICIRYLEILGPAEDTVRLFRESHTGEPTVGSVHKFLLDLESEHSKGTDWLVGNWLMDMVNLKDILSIPLSRNEVLYLRLRIECANVLLPLLCGSDPQDPPNPKFCLSIRATSEREAVHWALTSFWHQVWPRFYRTESELLTDSLHDG